MCAASSSRRSAACRRRSATYSIAEQRQNRLRSDEYDYATWSTRSWRAFAVQKLAVATQRAAAMEIARAMGLTTAYDTRGVLSGGPECAVM